MLQSLIWLSTEGELAMNDKYNERDDEEHQLFLEKLKFMAILAKGDRNSKQNWLFNAKELRS